MLYFHFNDSIQQVCGDSVTENFLFDDTLIAFAGTQDSLSFSIIDETNCYSTKVMGIPLCVSCVSTANRVLHTAYRLAFVDKLTIQGSCWDFVNKVFSMTTTDSIRKKDIYFEKKTGPYAPIDLLQPGDWVYHINHEFNQIEHSAIFVGWADYESGIAIVIDYIGLNRKRAAKFGLHNLNSVYAVFRMVKQNN